MHLPVGGFLFLNVLSGRRFEVMGVAQQWLGGIRRGFLRSPGGAPV